MTSAAYDLVSYLPGAALIGLGLFLIAVRRRWSRFIYENDEWWARHPMVARFAWLFSWRGIVLANEEHARDARVGALVVGFILILCGLALSAYNFLIAET